MKKKILVLASSLLFITSTGCNAEPITASSSSAPVIPVQFKDIAAHWAKKSIETAISKGYIDGYEDHTFKPDTNISRAEFIKMAVTALKLPITGKTVGSEWFVPYATAAENLGIYKSADFSLDAMNKPMTRIEMARVALRSANKDYQDPKAITNDPSIMYNATKMGLIQGLSGGELGVDEVTTRAQSVTIIERILSVKDGGKLEVDQNAVSNADLVLKKTNIFSVMPDIFGGKQLQGEEWDTNKLTLETPDGLWKGSIDQIIAIDLNDPKDPNRYLLGDFNTLRWFDIVSVKTSPLVKDGYTDSYAIYFKGHVDFNKDTDIYNTDFTQPGFSITGSNGSRKEMISQHKLTNPTRLFHNEQTDLPAFIISKKDITWDTQISISIYAPARPPHSIYEQTVVTLAKPAK